MSIEALSSVIEATSVASASLEVASSSVALPLATLEVASELTSISSIGEVGPQFAALGDIPAGIQPGVSDAIGASSLSDNFSQVDATSLENVRAELLTFQKNSPDEMADVVEPVIVDTQENIESLDAQNNFSDDVSLNEDTTNGEDPTGEDIDTTEQKNIDEDKTAEDTTDESKEEVKEEDQTEDDPEKKDEETSEDDEASEEENEENKDEEQQEDEEEEDKEEEDKEEEQEDEKKKKKEERPEQIVPSYVPDVDEQRVGQLTASIVKSAAENGGKVSTAKVAGEFAEKAVISPLLTSTPIGLPEATPSMSTTDGTISLIRQQMESLGDAAGVREAMDTALSAVDTNHAIGWGNAPAAEGDIAKVTGAPLRRSAGQF